MRCLSVFNISKPLAMPIKAKYCKDYFCKLRGLMFQQQFDKYSGLLLVDDRESRLNVTIHMFFMFCDITVIWINSQLTVVDIQMARSWPLLYIPRSPACYVLETHPERLTDFHIGDRLLFKNA